MPGQEVQVLLVQAKEQAEAKQEASADQDSVAILAQVGRFVRLGQYLRRSFGPNKLWFCASCTLPIFLHFNFAVAIGIWSAATITVDGIHL